jgi:hypothetical protein
MKATALLVAVLAFAQVSMGAVSDTPTPEPPPTQTVTLTPTKTHTPTPGYRVEITSSSFTLDGVTATFLYIYDGPDASRKGAVYHQAALELSRKPSETNDDIRTRLQAEIKRYVLANKHAWEPKASANVPTPNL